MKIDLDDHIIPMISLVAIVFFVGVLMFFVGFIDTLAFLFCFFLTFCIASVLYCCVFLLVKGMFRHHGDIAFSSILPWVTLFDYSRDQDWKVIKEREDRKK